MPRSFKQGQAAISLDDDGLVRTLDKVAGGLPSAFVKETSGELRPIMRVAVASWPVRYKNSRNSRGSFRFYKVLRGNTLEAGIENTAKDRGKGYAWFVRYSRRDKASLEREIETVRGIAQRAEAYSETVSDEEVRDYFFMSRSRRLANAAALELPWVKNLDTITAGGLVALYQDALYRRHGTGAINSSKAGKSIWAQFVRRPGRRASKRIVARLQADLLREARR